MTIAVKWLTDFRLLKRWQVFRPKENWWNNTLQQAFYMPYVDPARHVGRGQVSHFLFQGQGWERRWGSSGGSSPLGGLGERCILEAPNGISWNLLGAKFRGAWPPEIRLNMLQTFLSAVQITVSKHWMELTALMPTTQTRSSASADEPRVAALCQCGNKLYNKSTKIKLRSYSITVDRHVTNYVHPVTNDSTVVGVDKKLDHWRVGKTLPQHVDHRRVFLRTRSTCCGEIFKVQSFGQSSRGKYPYYGEDSPISLQHR